MLKKYIRTSGALSVLASAALFFAVSCTQTVPDPVAPPPPPTVAPAFVTQPADVSAAVGTNANFTATINASAYPAPTFQWQVSVDSGTTWTDVTGATSLTYSWVSVAAGDDGAQLRCQATNAGGNATSTVANLTVTGGVVDTPPHAGQVKIFELTGTGLNMALSVNGAWGWANTFGVTPAVTLAGGETVSIVIAGTCNVDIPAANGGLKAMILTGNPWTELGSWATATMVAGPVTANTAFTGLADHTAVAGTFDTCQVTYGTGTVGTEPASNLTLTKFQIWK